MGTVISTKGLTKIYFQGKTDLFAVKNVSVEIEKGEKVAIIGASGCGKTTLLNMIGLVITPNEGDIMVFGDNISGLSDRALTRFRNQVFGYVMQDFALIEGDSIYNNVEIPLLYNSEKTTGAERRRRVRAALEMAGLYVEPKERVMNLSGGQRQRVAIARAIINNPKIILADEPTGSLDSQSSDDIMTLLCTLVDEGKTLVLVTHNLELAARCDRRLKMRDGEIVR